MKYKYTRKEAIELARNNGYGFKSLEKLLLAKQEDKKDYRFVYTCPVHGEYYKFCKKCSTQSPLDSIEEIEKYCQNRLLWKYVETESLVETINSLIRNQKIIISYLKGKK